MDLVQKKLEGIRRRDDSNKVDYGHLLVCAGSYGMAGAAVMCGLSAITSGAGLVTYYTYDEIVPVLQTNVPQAMCKSIDKEIIMGKYDAIAMGPGFLGEKAEKRIKRIIKGFIGSLVLDANALNVIARDELCEDLKEIGKRTVLTPHEGEMGRLLGTTSSAVKADRRGSVILLSQLTGCTAVLKGSETLVAGGDGTVYVNTSGNPGLATAGTGDVLTGIISGLAAQGMNSLDAAITGVFIHGHAGDLAKRKKGEISMTAADVIDMIPSAFMDAVK